MAHFAVGFFALGLLALVLGGPAWAAAAAASFRCMLSVCIVRLRTVADRDTVTARSLLGSETVRWEDIDGLRFGRSSWARAHLKDGRELRFPR